MKIKLIEKMETISLYMNVILINTVTKEVHFETRFLMGNCFVKKTSVSFTYIFNWNK